MASERPYTPYEQKARLEIEAWRDDRGGVLTKALQKAGDVLAPVGRAAGRVVPDPVKQTVGQAVLGALELMKDAAYWTYRDADILRVARSEGAAAKTTAGLADEELETLDRTARRMFKSNKMTAMLEGAGCGLGGWAFVAADVPALFAVSFRAVQQIGTCYGFDMRDPEMIHVVMRVFSAGTAVAPEIKAAALFDMHVAAMGLARGWTYKQVAEKARAGAAVAALKKATEGLPRDIQKHVTKAKLAQAIPIAGAAVGGFFNYRFLSNTCRSAYMLFRELYLARKYDSDTPLDGDGPAPPDNGPEPAGPLPNEPVDAVFEDLDAPEDDA